MDLGNINDIKNFIEIVKKNLNSIDILILNALNKIKRKKFNKIKKKEIIESLNKNFLGNFFFLQILSEKLSIKNKIKIGFVTSTTLDNIDAVFKTLNNQIKKNHFDFIGNNKLIKEAKPAPDIYIKALNSLELNSSECIAIEDSVESALSAYRAKIKCIAFPGLFHVDDDFSFCLKKLNKLNTSIFN